MENMGVSGTKKILEKHAGLEGEILQEIAEALGNSGEKVERALHQLQQSRDRIQDLQARLEETDSGPARDALLFSLREEVHLYNALRQTAKERLKELLIHREAVGFRNHSLVREQYRIPPPIEPPEGD